MRKGTENPFSSPSSVRLEVLRRWSLNHDSREKTRRGGVGSTSGQYSGEGSIPFPESLFSQLLCNNCLGRTTGDTYGLSDQSIIGKGDTPTFPASDLRSSDVRFTLTKSVCKTDEFGCSTAGCHGERSELGDASRETSPTDTQGLSVEPCLKKETDIRTER